MSPPFIAQGLNTASWGFIYNYDHALYLCSGIALLQTAA